MEKTEMSARIERVNQALAHKTPDRTPLFEIFQPFHPIHWDIVGQTIGSHEGMCWDAMADGVDWQEIVEAQARASYAINKYFELDMIRLNGPAAKPGYSRPKKLGPNRWERDGKNYILNEQTKLVILENPAEDSSYTHRFSEEKTRQHLEEWDGSISETKFAANPVYTRVREMAEADGIDWVYMAEMGGGTAATFFPPFLLMWIVLEPELFIKWQMKQHKAVLPRMRQAVADGQAVISLGGDVSSDKGPIISPDHYREYVLPLIREQVEVVHEASGKAVYTSDGNHWKIYEDMLFRSGIDGYKEVDQAAGMTFPKLIEHGIDKRVCIIGNMDARYVMCLGSEKEVTEATIQCLKWGQESPGGHILHLSHSVHEDVKKRNYKAMVRAYREYFGLPKLPDV